MQQVSASQNNPKLRSIRELAESPNLTSVPSNYAYFSDPIQLDLDLDSPDSLPVIDLFLLQFGSPQQRSIITRDLAKACQDWGFFMVVNHGVSEELIKAMIQKCDEFFNLAEEERQEFKGKHVMDPIRSGTSFNTSVENVNFWRDFLKVLVHPNFHCPTKPQAFSEIAVEYITEIRRVAGVLLRGISTGLGLEEDEIERSLNLQRSQQIMIANYYPPCPQPNVAIGLPPHSDHGLLTILSENQVSGLQILHNGKWVPAHALPNSFLVNTADQMEIFSNGRYKSVLHRATVNKKAKRISIAIANGPSLDTVVSPASLLIGAEEHGSAKYKPMMYKDFIELQQSNRLHGKSCLDLVRVSY